MWKFHFSVQFPFKGGTSPKKGPLQFSIGFHLAVDFGMGSMTPRLYTVAELWAKMSLYKGKSEDNKHNGTFANIIYAAGLA